MTTFYRLLSFKFIFFPNFLLEILTSTSNHWMLYACLLYAQLSSFFFVKHFSINLVENIKADIKKPHSHIPFKCPKIYKYFPEKCEGFYFF